MMKQYEEAKRACPDALLLFRMGDFYEMFGEDAEVGARVPHGLAQRSQRLRHGLELAGEAPVGGTVAAHDGGAQALEERTGLPVKLWDERLTSVEAGRVLRSSGISIEKRAAAVARLSAVILLQSYLDSL